MLSIYHSIFFHYPIRALALKLSSLPYVLGKFLFSLLEQHSCNPCFSKCNYHLTKPHEHLYFVHTFIVINNTGCFVFFSGLDNFELFKKKMILTTKFTHLFLHAGCILYSEYTFIIIYKNTLRPQETMMKRQDFFHCILKWLQKMPFFGP